MKKINDMVDTLAIVKAGLLCFAGGRDIIRNLTIDSDCNVSLTVDCLTTMGVSHLCKCFICPQFTVKVVHRDNFTCQINLTRK